MKKTTKLTAILLIISTILFLNGCAEVQIFKSRTDPYALAPVKDEELVDDQYYVKENTNFYKVHMPVAGNASSGTNTLQESRVLMTMLDDDLIPPHYSDELIAFASEEIDFDYINLERFKCLGCTIGGYGGTLTEDGYLYLDKRTCIVQDSSLYNVLDKSSDNIRIASINGQPLDKSLVDTKAGVITGFEKDKTYKIGLYAGTRYYEYDIVADCKAYQAYEMFYFDKDYIEDTANGYMRFNTPDTLKPGYYNINGTGLFKYYNFERGAQNEAETDMNEPYYQDEKSKLEAYSRQYSVNVPNRVRDFKIKATYDSYLGEHINKEEIQGVVFAPDGSRMDMDVDTSKNTISLSMAEAMPGEWTVNIIPKTLEISSVDVEKDDVLEDATCEETIFNLPDDRENVEIIAEYTTSRAKVSDCTVFGMIITEDNTTYEMELFTDETDKKNPRYFIKYELPYAKAGEYVVRIYHFPEETKILAPELKDKTVQETEIIVIDG